METPTKANETITWQRNYKWEMRIAGYMLILEGREESPEAVAESYFKALHTVEKKLGLNSGELLTLLKTRIGRMK